MNYQDKLALWLSRAGDDPDLAAELKQVQNDPDAVSDRFYRDLEFGTGGLRGVIGAGTNRMNIRLHGHGHPRGGALLRRL